MTLTWGLVQQWRSAPLDQAGRKLAASVETMQRLSDDLDKNAVAPSWKQEAAEAAKRKLTETKERLEDLVTEVSAGRRAMFDASDAVKGIERSVTDAESFAVANQLSISAAGVVTDAAPPKVYRTTHDAEMAQAERTALIQQCVADLEQILRKAADIDADLGKVLASIQSGQLSAMDSANVAAAATSGDSAGKASVLPPPAGKGKAADNAAWWATLSDAERAQVIKDHPDWIGNRDGVDFRARDKANRALLPTYRARLKAEEADIRRKMANASYTYSGIAGGEVNQLSKQLLVNQKKQKSLDTVERILAKGDRQLLGLDIDHDRTQAIISVGDASTADKVITMAPGLTSTVEGMEGYDTNMSDLKKRTELNLTRHHESGTVAAITWIGYQAPQVDADSVLSSNSVVSSEAAQVGGKAEAEFFRGVNASRVDDPDLTALGHSYGSTTTGYAMREYTGVDRVAYFGSPGIGVDSLNQQQVPTGQSYYAEADFDGVGDLRRFGTDPSYISGMHQMDTHSGTAADGTHLNGVSGHTSYLQDGSTSQYNLAAVAAGHPGDAIAARPEDTPGGPLVKDYEPYRQRTLAEGAPDTVPPENYSRIVGELEGRTVREAGGSVPVILEKESAEPLHRLGRGDPL